MHQTSPRHRSSRRRIAAGAALLAAAACTHAPRAPSPSVDDDPVVADGLRRLRAATAPYKNLDAAVAAGYAPTVADCIVDEHHGAMGYHHLNRRYVDGTLDVTKPEFLLYERMPDSSYRLNGAEFIVPYRFWSRDSAAPVLMGQKLHHENNFNYWYLHVWAWTNNTEGVFANMNPDVKCPGGGKVYTATADST